MKMEPSILPNGMLSHAWITMDLLNGEREEMHQYQTMGHMALVMANSTMPMVLQLETMVICTLPIILITASKFWTKTEAS